MTLTPRTGFKEPPLDRTADLMAAAATTMSTTGMAASVVLACSGLTKLRHFGTPLTSRGRLQGLEIVLFLVEVGAGSVVGSGPGSG